MDTQEFEASHTFHFSSINVNGSVCVAFLSLPVVHNQLRLLGIECKIVVCTPHCQTTAMLSANLMMMECEPCSGK